MLLVMSTKKSTKSERIIAPQIQNDPIIKAISSIESLSIIRSKKPSNKSSNKLMRYLPQLLLLQ